MSRCNRPYGLCVDQNGKTVIQLQEAEIVREIFRSYLAGSSLGKIADMLHERHIPSPSGAERWSRASIDYILSNKWYAPHLVDPEYFAIVQAEKKCRSEHGSGTLLKGKDILSGMLICTECGAKYRRITRPSGEVVWRCANRVEHGKKICKLAPTITDVEIRSAICQELKLPEYDETKIKSNFAAIFVSTEGLQFDYNDSRNLDMAR